MQNNKLSEHFDLLFFFEIPADPVFVREWKEKFFEQSKVLVDEEIIKLRNRTAEDENDFQFILDREFEKAKIEKDKIKYFVPILIEKIDQKIFKHKSTSDEAYWDGAAIILAETFKDWLYRQINESQDEENSSNKHSVSAVALTFIYPLEAGDSGIERITMNNRDRIARDHGFVNGRKLWEKYNLLQNKKARIPTPSDNKQAYNRKSVDIKNAFEALDIHKFPKGKALAKREKKLIEDNKKLDE